MGERVGLVILSGGRSTRMGQDKAALPWGDETLLTRMGRILDFFPERLLSVAPAQSHYLDGYTNVVDLVEGLGPIGGIYSALKYAASDALLAVSCDMPMYGATEAKEAVEAFLEAGTDILLPIADGEPQMLAAVYSKGCLPMIEQMIADRIYKLRVLTELVPTRTLFVENALCYTGVNTREAYERMLALLHP